MPTMPTMMSWTWGLVLVAGASGLDNGIARQPPMGWRSWNTYWFDIDQPLIERAMDVLVDTSRMVDGKPTSLAELGYNNGGIDDGWQQCDHSGKHWHGAYFHNDTTPNGWPVVNSTLFPDVPGMVKRAHAKGLGINWYMNNCRCNEQNPYPANEVNDVAWLIDNGFNARKNTIPEDPDGVPHPVRVLSSR